MNTFESASKPEVAMDFLIRPGTEADLENMALVTERAYAESRNQLPPDVLPKDSDDYKELQERAHYDGYWSLLALDGDKLAGFVAGYPGNWKGQDDGSNSEYLYLLMVDPDYQGKGVGPRLLGDVIENAKQKNRRSLALWVEEGLKNAIALYEHKGFKNTEHDISDRHGKVLRYQLDLN